MNKNKVLAVALSAGLVLGGAYVADTNVAFAAATDEGRADARLDAAEAELKKAEGELAEAKAELAELWAEAGNLGSDDDTNPIAAEFEAKSKEVENLEQKVAAAKAKVQEAKKEKAEKEKAEELAKAKEAAKQKLINAGFREDSLVMKYIDSAKTKEAIDALVAESIASREKTKAEDLAKAKEAAKKDLKDAGVENQMLYDMIDNAKTIEGVEAAKKEILESVKESALDKAKEAARQELRDAGIKGQIFYNMINNAKTIEGVNAVKDEILKSHKDSKPSEGNKTTLDDWIIAQNSKDGYFTKEDAEAAAKLYLEKHPEFNSYRIMKGLKGNYYFVPEINEKEEDKKPEDKRRQSLDDWQIEQNEKDGYFTKEDALRAGNLALDRSGLKGLYEVEVAQNQKEHKGMWFWRFVPKAGEKPEDKPGIPWTPLTPAEPIPDTTPDYPNPVPGGDNEVVVPGEKPADKPEEKPEDNKETEIKEEKPNEGKDKEEKAKPSKEKAKPAKQKGNNPKTGLVGLAPIYSTLAISMAGIVAARKKND